MSLPHTRVPVGAGSVATVDELVVAGTEVVGTTEVRLAVVVVVSAPFAATGDVVVPHAANTNTATDRTAAPGVRHQPNRGSVGGRG